MEENFYHFIPEYEQFKQLHTLIELKAIYHTRTTLLGSAIQEANDRISSGRYNSIDEMVELRNVLPVGEKRLQELREMKEKLEKEINELTYLLN